MNNSNWIEAHDPEGRKYYWNKETNQTAWTIPITPAQGKEANLDRKNSGKKLVTCF
jgi:hypothetical protein